MHLTGLGGSGASRVSAQHPPPSPVPAPAAHGACLGQMPAGSNRERPKLFGSGEEEEPVLPAHPPPPPSLLTAPRRGAEAAGPAAISAQHSGVGTAGKVIDRGSLRDGEGDLLGFGTSRGPRGCTSQPIPRPQGMVEPGRAPRSSALGPRRDAPPRGGTHGGAAAPQPAGTRCGAPRDAVQSPPAGAPSPRLRAPAATTPEGC